MQFIGSSKFICCKYHEYCTNLYEHVSVFPYLITQTLFVDHFRERAWTTRTIYQTSKYYWKWRRRLEKICIFEKINWKLYNSHVLFLINYLIYPVWAVHRRSAVVGPMVNRWYWTLLAGKVVGGPLSVRHRRCVAEGPLTISRSCRWWSTGGCRQRAAGDAAGGPMMARRMCAIWEPVSIWPNPSKYRHAP